MNKKAAPRRCFLNPLHLPPREALFSGARSQSNTRAPIHPNSHITNTLAHTGIVSNLRDDANILVKTDVGTFNVNGRLDKERVRLVVRGQLLALKLIQDWGDRIADGR